MFSLLLCPRCRASPLGGCPCKAQVEMRGGIPLFSPEEIETSSFEPDRLERIAELERDHFWFRARRSLVEKLLFQMVPPPARIADLGCGTGFLLEQWLQKGYEGIGVDLHPERLSALQKRWPQALLIQSNVEQVPIVSSSCDGVLLLDVLEHVDDQKTLGETYRLLRRGGHVILTVPAYSWLWSRRDKKAGHRRRYSRRSLEALLSGVGFVIEEIGYYQSLLFPLFVASRLLSRVFPLMERVEEEKFPLFNSLFAKINEWEKGRSFPFGSSLVAVGKKRDGF